MSTPNCSPSREMVLAAAQLRRLKLIQTSPVFSTAFRLSQA
jgi:hypothetical protein